MAEIDASLVLEHLKRIQEPLGRMEDRMETLGSDMRTIKGHMVASMSNEVVQDGQIATLSARIERIERRLDLRDEA